MDALLAAIDGALHSDPIVDAELRVPQHEGAALAAIEAGMVVHSREYEGNLVRLTVSGPASLVGRMRRFRAIADKRCGSHHMHLAALEHPGRPACLGSAESL